MLRVRIGEASQALYGAFAIMIIPMVRKCGELLHPVFPQAANVHLAREENRATGDSALPQGRFAGLFEAPATLITIPALTGLARWS